MKMMKLFLKILITLKTKIINFLFKRHNFLDFIINVNKKFFSSYKKEDDLLLEKKINLFYKKDKNIKKFLNLKKKINSSILLKEFNKDNNELLIFDLLNNEEEIEIYNYFLFKIILLKLENPKLYLTFLPLIEKIKTLSKEVKSIKKCFINYIILSIFLTFFVFIFSPSYKKSQFNLFKKKILLLYDVINDEINKFLNKKEKNFSEEDFENLFFEIKNSFILKEKEKIKSKNEDINIFLLLNDSNAFKIFYIFFFIEKKVLINALDELYNFNIKNKNKV